MKNPELRVLVVEDNDGQRELMVGMLEALGVLHIEAASSGRIANEILDRGHFAPDLVITDLMMRDGDGFDVLRAALRLPKPPMLVVTSAADTSVLAAIDKLRAHVGAAAVEAIPKPIELERLCHVLETAGNRLIAAPRQPFSPAEVERGLDAGEFTAFLEPQFDLHSGEIVGFEALARWRHPEHGVIPPARFIPVIERSPLMARLTLALLDDLLATRAALNAAGFEPGCSLNFGAECLADPGFPVAMERTLNRHGLRDGRGLTLELTESEGAENVVDEISGLARLRLLGFKLALDDFGIGHSSLAKMHNGAFSEIKIDRDFTSKILSDRLSRAAVESIISIAQSLGWVCISEGIETEAIRHALARLGCRTGQGYLVSPPIDPTLVVGWLQAWNDGSRRRLAPLEPAPGKGAELRPAIAHGGFARVTVPQLMQLERREIPSWLFDLETFSISWANSAALGFWQAESLADLAARNFKDDLSATAKSRLRAYLELLADDRVASERWTLYPRGVPVSIDCLITGVTGPNGHRSMLVEAFGEGTLQGASRLEIEAASACATALLAYDADGEVLWRNAAAVLAYGRKAGSLASVLGNAEAARNLLGAAFAAGESTHDLDLLTPQGPSRQRVQLRVATEPNSGRPILIASQTPIDDLVAPVRAARRAGGG